MDSVRDPEGDSNLMEIYPNKADLYARAAQRYFDVYPWVVVQGRSGLPASGPRTPRKTAWP